MRDVFRQLWKTLHGGTIGLLVVIILVTALALVGKVSGQFSMPEWLAMDPSGFLKGKIWVVVSHAFLPVGPVDLIFSGLMVLMMGIWIERFWSASELWIYSLLVAAGTGVAKLLLLPVDNTIIHGVMPLSIGLLAAVFRLCGHERVLFMGVMEMTVRQLVILIMVLDIIILFTACGVNLTSSLAVLAAWPAGWFYLSLRWRWIKAGSSQKVETSRTRRLEL